jgi:hypothetical protein
MRVLSFLDPEQEPNPCAISLHTAASAVRGDACPLTSRASGAEMTSGVTGLLLTTQGDASPTTDLRRSHALTCTRSPLNRPMVGISSRAKQATRPEEGEYKHEERTLR